MGSRASRRHDRLWLIGLVLLAGGCTQLYVSGECLDHCSQWNDQCLLRALDPSTVQRCDEGTAACTRSCYSQ